MLRNHIFQKKLLIDLFIMVILIGSNLFIGYYMRDDLVKQLSDSDDVYHISIANSFREKKNFEIDFLDLSIYRYASEDMFKLFPTLSNEQTGKGPLYYIFLGSFYELLSTTPEDFYFHASIFNNLLTSIFLVAFFFFVKKKFDLKIALVSSILISLIPFFGWISARVLLYPLLYIFLILALFFTEKKKTHYLIFGVLAGLALLTHPFGIFIGITYALFLLLNKEFKGCLLSIITWHAVLIPWFLRNYYLFKDIGWGLFLPYSEVVSKSLFFLPQKAGSNISESSFIPASFEKIEFFSPFSVFEGMFKEFSQLYHMDYLLILIFLTFAFVFFKLDKFQKNIKYIIMIILGIASSYTLIYYHTEVAVHIIFAFVIPIALACLLYKKAKWLFVEPANRTNNFIIFFIFINFIGYYLVSLVYHRQVPETKMIMFPIFLLVPLSILAVDKIIRQVKFKKISIKKLVYVLVFGLILSPIMIQMAQGIEFLNNYPANIESGEMVKINQFIRDDVSPDANVFSNLPHIIFLKTGLRSIALPLQITDQNELDKLITHYKISYVIFYDLEPSTPYKEVIDYIKQYPVNYYFRTVKVVGDSYVLKIDNILNSDISNPIAYLMKARLLEMNDNIDESNQIYAELRNLEPNIKIAEVMCTRLTEFQRFEDAEHRCDYVLKKNPSNKVALNGLLISYIHTQQKEKIFETLSGLDEIGYDEDTLNAYDDIIEIYRKEIANSPRNADDIQKAMISIMKDKAELLTILVKYSKAVRAYDEIISLDQFDWEAWKEKAILLEKLNRLPEAIRAYEFASRIESYEAEAMEKIEELKNRITKESEIR